MIQFATIHDVEDIMGFIDLHWQKGHILGRNKELFLAMHQTSETEISYVIHRAEEGNQIDAVLGFIPYSDDVCDVMGVIWLSKNLSEGNIGFRMWLHLKECSRVRISGTVGNNKKVVGIYKAMGFHTGFLTQWYRLGELSSYFIADVQDKSRPEPQEEQQYPLVKLENIDAFTQAVDPSVYEKRERKPYKSLNYISRRYFDFPIYTYEVYGVQTSDTVYSSVLVLRKEIYKTRCVLRFVDCLGDVTLIKNCTQALDMLLAQCGGEYIDMYCVGLDEGTLTMAGWRKVQESGNIIPNYFNPFVRENIEIRYCTTDRDIVLFKGDGDQDRPS